MDKDNTKEWQGYGDISGTRRVHVYRKDYTYNPESYGEEILSHWRLPSKAKVLDIASGKGGQANILYQLYQAKVIQTDLSSVPLLIQNSENSSKLLLVAESSEQPFPTGSFDAVHVKDAFAHFGNQEMFINEAARLVKKGGKLLITFEPLEDSRVDLYYYGFPWLPEFKSIPINSYNDYRTIVNQIVRDEMMHEGKKVVEITPPYFSSDPKEILLLANKAGFDLDNLIPKSWKPKESEQDWMKTVERRVLGFIKK